MSQYIQKDQYGRPVVLVDSSNPLDRILKTAQETTASVSPLVAALALKEDKSKREEGSVTSQGTASDQIQRRYARTVDPSQTSRMLLQLAHLSPPGLKKQSEFTDEMTDALKALVGSYGEAPLAAMKLGGAAKGIDQLFGTNVSEIITDTPHKLAMAIPKYAELVEKAQGKRAQNELAYAAQLMKDFDTQATKTSDQLTAVYKDLSPMSKDKTIPPGQDEGLEVKARDRVTTMNAIARKAYATLSELKNIISKYPPDKVPGLGGAAGGAPQGSADLFEKDPRRKKDFQRIKALQTILAKDLVKEYDGAKGSDMDFRKILESLGVGFFQDPRNFFDTVNSGINRGKSTFGEFYNNLMPREQKYYDKNINEKWRRLSPYDYKGYKPPKTNAQGGSLDIETLKKLQESLK